MIGLFEARSPAVDLVTAVATTALNLLPAVLLQLALGGRQRIVTLTGYLLSTSAIGIHWSEFVLGAPEFHSHGLRFTTFSFGALTAVAALALLLSRETGKGQRMRRLLGTMALFLFALSFVHFGFELEPRAWPVEVLIHHAGIPLALFVLLQDFRFVLLDAFIRVVANLAVAGATIAVGLKLAGAAGVEYGGGNNPFRIGILLVGAALALVAFAFYREKVQRVLTRTLFRRTDLDVVLKEVRTHEHLPGDEQYLDWAVTRIGRYLDTQCRPVPADVAGCLRGADVLEPILVAQAGECRERLEAAGGEMVFPLRLTQDEVCYYLLERRPGGRPYLSGDIEALARLTAEIVDHVKHYRDLELRRLISQAELRALQAQIHPHFLFNALNTLYGVIPREAPGARQMVLNLADILRYFLDSGKTYIPLEEELKIVRAYLELEQLRLGDRLRATVEASPETLSLPIPVLSVQPLVENAVRHGVSAKAEGGEVTVRARLDGDELEVRVTDSGSGFPESAGHGGEGHGVALENVRRRLQLCYGPATELSIHCGPEGSIVGYRVPIQERVPATT